MRKLVAGGGLVLAILIVPGVASAAPNPSGTGLPGQSCQLIEKLGGTVPGAGHSNTSIGSPFNEAGIDSALGGIGGQHYNETSQYDVACFQVS